MQSRRLAPLLWLLLALFCARLIGQVLVALFQPSFLPPMHAWYSGLVPYYYLLPLQVLILVLMVKICVDFTRGTGFFVRPYRAFVPGVPYFGYAYLAAMVLRYLLRMGLYPKERWFGGAIPIVFHWVLAAFVITLGRYHRSLHL